MTELVAGPVDPFLKNELNRSGRQCPECGSFLDALRVNPATGDLGRKCMACEEWHPLVPTWWTEARHGRSRNK